MSGNSLVDATLGLIEKGEDTMFTRSSMGDGKMKKDANSDTGHKKGKQPDSTGGKAEKMGKLSEAVNKKEQGQFDSLINDIVKPGRRMEPKKWEELFGIMAKAEKTGVNMDKVSKVTMLNFKQYKKRLNM